MAYEEVYEGTIVDEDESSTTTETLPALDSITRSEIDMQIATAKRYPRSIAKVKKDIMDMATLDEETAESCFYSLDRKGEGGKRTLIQGPSVRMAEIALCCFGNVRAGTRGLGETEDGKFVRELGVFHDVEKNVMVSKEVKRRIIGKSGKKYGDDMIGVTMAAAAAIAFRNAVLTGIPRSLIKPAFDKAREVALGKTKSLKVRTGEIIARLQKLSSLITLDMILARVEKRALDDLGWDDLEALIGLGTAIKDGMQTVEEAFPDPDPREKPVAATASAGPVRTTAPPAATGASLDVPADPGGHTLSPGHVKALFELARAEPSVSWQEFEGQYGKSVDEVASLPGESEDALYNRLLEDLGAMKDQAEKAQGAGGSLFDADEKPKSATTTKK